GDAEAGTVRSSFFVVSFIVRASSCKTGIVCGWALCAGRAMIPQAVRAPLCDVVIPNPAAPFADGVRYLLLSLLPLFAGSAARAPLRDAVIPNPAAPFADGARDLLLSLLPLFAGSAA